MKERVRRWGPTLVLCVLLVVCLVKIHNLELQLKNETGYLQGRISSLESSISNIYHNVDEKLEAEASQVAAADWTLDDIDVEKRTAVLECTVTPKLYEEGVTEAVLICNGQEYSMAMEDGTFYVRVTTDLFDTGYVEAVKLVDGDQIRTEYLDWTIYPREMLLPDLHAGFSGSSSFGQKNEAKKTSVWTLNGELDVRFDQKGDAFDGFTSIDLVKRLDGKELERTSIPADENGNYTMKFNLSGEVPFGGRYELTVEAVDSYGLVYRSLVHRWQSDRNGEPVEDDFWRGHSASIYDEKGNLLYTEV